MKFKNEDLKREMCTCINCFLLSKNRFFLYLLPLIRTQPLQKVSHIYQLLTLSKSFHIVIIFLVLQNQLLELDDLKPRIFKLRDIPSHSAGTPEEGCELPDVLSHSGKSMDIATDSMGKK